MSQSDMKEMPRKRPRAPPNSAIREVTVAPLRPWCSETLPRERIGTCPISKKTAPRPDETVLVVMAWLATVGQLRYFFQIDRS